MTSEQQAGYDEWLSLGEAAARLSIHPTTLRRWADNGDIPVMLTPGGHRRFSSVDLQQFAEQRHSRRKVNHLEQIWANRALTQTRREMSNHPDQPWLADIDEPTRVRHRQLGQRLMGLTLRYLADEMGSDHFLQEAHLIGEEYAAISLGMQLSLTDALQASIFFRDMLVETALNLPENSQARPEASLRLLRRINRLLNTVHLAIAETYDAAFTDSLPRT